MGSLDRAGQRGAPQAGSKRRLGRATLQSLGLCRYSTHARAAGDFRGKSPSDGVVASKGNHGQYVGLNLHGPVSMTPSASEAFVPLAGKAAAGHRREDFRVLVSERPELARPLSE